MTHFRLRIWTFLAITLLLPLTRTQPLSAEASFFIPENDTMPYQAVRRKMGYTTTMPSTGDVPMLVIPISFSDYPCDDLPYGCEGTQRDIERAFFGAPEETGWHSVASYLDQSSYGALHLTGTVTDWFTPTITAVQLSNKPTGGLSANVLQPAIAWFKANYQGPWSAFDSDEDGFFDAVYLVYSVEARPEDEAFGEDRNIFWAFTSYIGGIANPSDPSVFHFCWSSYDFMYQDGYYDRDAQGRILRDPITDEPVFHPWEDDQGKMTVDSHVYIHEVGHLLGLMDYYTYDSDLGDWGASGALDMMDYNVGDHNALSKAFLQWTKPRVITGNTALTLKPFNETGEFLLLKNTYQNTMMDEYLLLEFYAPTELNEKDAAMPYAGRYPKMFSEYGVKIYHVDARVAQYHVVGGQITFRQYVTVLDQDPKYSYTIAFSNTASRSNDPNLKFLHLLEADGVNSFKHTGYATNRTLFKTGDTFNDTVWPNYAMHDGVSFRYQIQIGTIAENGVSLTIQTV